jgi:hypothetical protein
MPDDRIEVVITTPADTAGLDKTAAGIRGAAGTVAMCLHGQTGVTTNFYSNATRPATMSQALDTTAATWIDITVTPSATTCSFAMQQLALEVLD